MTIMGLIYTLHVYDTSHNVGALKVVNLHCSCQQCLVAELSGRSVTVRVRVRARARERDFFFLCVKVYQKNCAV